jgi:hypothetical protein
MKMVGMLKKVKLRGIDKVGWLFTFNSVFLQIVVSKARKHTVFVCAAC